MPRSRSSPTRPPSLPPELAAERGITVVPLQVVIGGHGARRGRGRGDPREWSPRRCATSSRSAPRGPRRPRMLEAYEEAARDGATEVVSIHLSGEMSGTFESAQLAAREARCRCVAVDSRQVGVATGYAVLAAADVARRGRDRRGGGRGRARRGPPRRRRCSTSTRWSTCAAAAGSAPRPRCSGVRWRSSRCCRSRTAGWRRWRRSAPPPGRWPGSRSSRSQAAGEPQVDVCVAHLASPERAGAARRAPAERLAGQPRGREVWCGELGAVLGAHVGPGHAGRLRGAAGLTARPDRSRGSAGGPRDVHRAPRDGVVHRRRRPAPVEGRGCLASRS